MQSLINSRFKFIFKVDYQRKLRLVLVLLSTVFLSTSALGQSVKPLAGGSTKPFYDDIGGRHGVQRIVEKLVSILLADTRVSATFEGVDMDHLRTRFEEQFCQLSGGSCIYNGKSMQEIHQDLKITNKQFNAVVEDLQSAMDACDVPSRAQNRLLARLASMQRQIVTH